MSSHRRGSHDETSKTMIPELANAVHGPHQELTRGTFPPGGDLAPYNKHLCRRSRRTSHKNKIAENRIRKSFSESVFDSFKTVADPFSFLFCRRRPPSEASFRQPFVTQPKNLTDIHQHFDRLQASNRSRPRVIWALGLMILTLLLKLTFTVFNRTKAVQDRDTAKL